MPASIGLSEITIGLISSYINPHAVIVGTSIGNFLDGTNASASNQDVAGDNYARWGWNSVSGNRCMPLFKIPLTAIPRRVEIADAAIGFVFVGRSTTMAGPITLNVHEVEGELNTGTTWLLRSTGIPWYGSGYGPAPGYDYNALPVGSRTLSATEVSAITAGGSSVSFPQYAFEFDVTRAVQARRDAGSDLQLICPVTWAGSTNYFALRYQTTSVNLNTYLRIRYWPALGVESANEAESGRGPDFTKLHNPDLAGNDYRTWLDVVEQGTTSATRKLWAMNFRRSGIRRDVVIGTSRSETTTVDSTASVSGITLRSADVYDTNSTTELTPTGDWVLAATDSTHYNVTYTDSAGVSTVLLEETTGLNAVTFAADHVFMYASKRALKIRTIKWSATTGANVADRWKFSTRGDLRTTQSLDTLAMVQVMPRDDGDQDLPESGRARYLKYAYTQQIRAAAANVVVSGTSKGHLQVRDTTNINWPTGSAACVTIFTPGGTTVVDDMKIVTVYPSTDGTYPDTLRFDRDFTGPELAAFAALTTSVTAGIYIGDIAKNAAQRVAAGGVAAGSGTLPLDAAFYFGTPAKVWIISPSTAVNEQVTVLSGSGTLTLASNLAHSYSGGELVFPVFDPSNPTELAYINGKPYYADAVVPASEPEGLYSGYYQLFEQKTIG